MDSSAEAPDIDAQLVADRIGELHDLIARHSVAPVTIVAVTKRFGPDAVRAAAAAGVLDVAENYAQELIAKATDLGSASSAIAALRWHFIGQLQRNKVRLLADIVHLWQSVDTVRTGREIAVRAPGSHVLVQVNITGAPNQAGCEPAEVSSLVDALRVQGLVVDGLMTIGAQGDRQRSRAAFSDVRRLADSLDLVECSMGMSGDLIEALEAGSTMVRIGTALFGPRPA